jgi:hypothetical protein
MSNIKALVNLVSGEGLVPCGSFLLCPHMVESRKAKGGS